MSTIESAEHCPRCGRIGSHGLVHTRSPPMRHDVTSDRTTWPWGLITNICAYGNIALVYVATRSLLWTVALGLLGFVLLTLGRVVERADLAEGATHVDQ